MTRTPNRGVLITPTCPTDNWDETHVGSERIGMFNYNPFAGYYTGSGQGQRQQQGTPLSQPLTGNALCQVAPDGQVTAVVLDLSTYVQRKWQGTINPDGGFLLSSPAPGPLPDTAKGKATFVQPGVLQVDIAAAGLGIAPEQWRFTLCLTP